MSEKDSSQSTALLEKPLDETQHAFLKYIESVETIEPVIEQTQDKVEPEKDSKEKVSAIPKKSSMGKLFILLIAVVLLSVGYLQRERVLNLISRITNRDSNSLNEQTNAIGGKRKILYWQDPMHPAYKSDKPGTAPDCGMDLEPVYEEDGSTTENLTNLPDGVIKISPAKQQLIGVQYGEVIYQPVVKTLRTVGRLAYDETKMVRVHTKIDGWVEDVFVNFTGKQVSKGEPLLSIYSPDLLQTQLEFLLAIRGRAELKETAFREAAGGAESLYQSARRRLELWDITKEQIDEIEERGSPIKTMTLYSPAEGFVLARNAYPKQRIMPDTELYSIVDMSTIWVIAEIYEFEASEIKLGQSADITLTYFPGRTYSGTITYIYPQVDNATRTLKVRIELPNQNFELKPDMYANVEMKIDYGKKLIVPQEAIMDSGSEQMVFIALEGGYFEPRKIKVGGRVDNKTIVLDGLKKGEQVVTSANFLIDSESKLQSATADMGFHSHGGSGTVPAKNTPKHEREHNQVQKVNQSTDDKVDHKTDHKSEKTDPSKNGEKKSAEHSRH
jgi:membrane fusion protein, copper/silver efflux system